MAGVNQVQINERVGLTFASGLRTILRQDPDIVMVGEIRDPETASIAMQASMTGHLVLSTLHTNDAPSAVSRLIDMGIEPFLITSSLTLVVGQRLARVPCEKCAEPVEASPRTLELLGLEPEEVTHAELRMGPGCLRAGEGAEPAVLVAADPGDRQAQDRAMAAGAAGLVAKPFVEAELRAEVAAVLERRPALA
jgi:type IV pilus assembly protein PilB